MLYKNVLYFSIIAIIILSILHTTQILQNYNQSQCENEGSTNLVNSGLNHTTLGHSHQHDREQIIPQDILDELDILSGGPEAKSLECPHPLVPFQNIIVRNDNSTSAQKQKLLIPKILHFSMKSRCLPRDLARTMDRWREALPNYSIFFHDDAAVARLIDKEWPAFPGLRRAMRCIIFKGAMTIDVWRILVLYKYGGVYSDIDNWPLSAFSETTIRSDLSAFFFSASWNRPSQSFMAAESNHPIMYLTMRQIIKNIWSMSVRDPRVVFVTGPDALRKGYQMFLMSSTSYNITLHTDHLQSDIVKTGLYDYRVLKTTIDGVIKAKHEYDHIVPFNSTLNVTREDRIVIDSGIRHWKFIAVKANKELKRMNVRKSLSCEKYLERLDEGLIDEIKPY